MAYEHDSDEGEVAQIRELVADIARRMGVENPLSTGYLVACQYLDDEGNELWALRSDPDLGYATVLGLAKLVELDADRVAAQTLGIYDDDEDD